tara:strand:+ start:1607 stop:1966 length:360 start_codon:yes stop_codon:yes gene_type:complete
MLVQLSMPKVNLLHIFLQSMILIYIGYTGKITEDNAYLALLATALLIPVFVPPPNFEEKNGRNINHLFHYLIVLPFFTYIAYMGYYERNLSDTTYFILLVLGIFIFIYHGYKFLTRLVQ